MELVEPVDECESIDFSAWYSGVEEPAAAITRTPLDALITNPVYSHFLPDFDGKPKVCAAEPPDVVGHNAGAVVNVVEPVVSPVDGKDSFDLSRVKVEQISPEKSLNTSAVDNNNSNEKGSEKPPVGENWRRLNESKDYDARLPVATKKESRFSNVTPLKDVTVTKPREFVKLNRSLDYDARQPLSPVAISPLDRTVDDCSSWTNKYVSTRRSDSVAVEPERWLEKPLQALEKKQKKRKHFFMDLPKCLYQYPNPACQTPFTCSSPSINFGLATSPMPIMTKKQRRKFSNFQFPANPSTRLDPPKLCELPTSLAGLTKKKQQFWAGMKVKGNAKVASGGNATPMGVSWMASPLPVVGESWTQNGSDGSHDQGPSGSQNGMSDCNPWTQHENSPAIKNGAAKFKQNGFNGPASNGNGEQNKTSWLSSWTKQSEQTPNSTFVYGQSPYGAQMDSSRFTNDGQWSGFGGNSLAANTNGFVEVNATIYGKPQIERSPEKVPLSLIPMPTSSDDYTECEMEISDEEWEDA